MKKYEIVHIIDSFATGGLERQVFNMILHGNKEAYVICLSKAGYLGDELTKLGECVFQLTSDSVAVRLFEIYRIIKKNPVEIIHTHNQKSYFYGSIIGRLFSNVQVLMSKHGETFIGGKLSSIISSLFIKKDHIVTVSEKIKSMCHVFFGGDINRIHVVANGVPFSGFLKKRKGKSLLVNIGSVGRLVKVKNYSLLINVFSKLVQDNDNIKLTIIGDGPERNNLEKLVANLGIRGKVVFAGLQRDVTSYLKEMDIFAITSDSEGLPIALLEAVSHSIPVVATEVGAIPNILMHNESVMLSPPNEEGGLFENLKSCVNDPNIRNSLAEKAYNRLKGTHSIASSISLHNEIYELVKKK